MSIGPESVSKTPPGQASPGQASPGQASPGKLGAPIIGRAPVPVVGPPVTFGFTVSSINVIKPRSFESDTDYATLAINALAADNTVITQYGPITRSLGGHGDNSVIDPQMSLTDMTVPEGGSLAVSFIVLNKGGWDWDSTAINALELAGAAVLGALAQGQIVAATVAAGPPAAVSLPEVLAVGGVIIIVLEGLNILLADCDGTVVPGALTLGQPELLQYANPGPWNVTFNYPGTNSPVGCGPNSNYSVTYSIEGATSWVTVPLVIGLSPKEAGAAYTAAGLTVGTSFIPVKGDVSEVITQSPPAGTSVPVGSQNEIEIGVPETGGPGGGGHLPQ